MFLVEWDFIYNPRSDSWEIVSNNAWASKSGAEDYVKEINKAETLVKQLEQKDKALDEIRNLLKVGEGSLGTDNFYDHEKIMLSKLKSILSQYKEKE